MRNSLDNRKPLKKKPCKVCKELFQPFSTLARTCSPSCAIEQGRLDRLKKAQRELKVFRADTRKRKEKLKDRSYWLKKAQEACNAYIRERDKNDGCCSCDTRKPDIQYCAGHFKSRGGHPELRFHPFNLNLQCNKNCNLHLSGNISEYRPRLIEKIGLSNVEWLEGPHEPQNWSIEDIQDIRQHYKEQLKLLKSI